jgi:hypothetical protein
MDTAAGPLHNHTPPLSVCLCRYDAMLERGVAGYFETVSGIAIEHSLTLPSADVSDMDQNAWIQWLPGWHVFLICLASLTISPRPLYGFSCLSSWLCWFVHVCVCGTWDGITAFLGGWSMLAAGICSALGLETSLVTHIPTPSNQMRFRVPVESYL